jgi:hypothetical protein
MKLGMFTLWSDSAWSPVVPTGSPYPAGPMSAAWLDRPVAKAPSDVASKPVKAARPRKPVVIEDEATAG